MSSQIQIMFGCWPGGGEGLAEGQEALQFGKGIWFIGVVFDEASRSKAAVIEVPLQCMLAFAGHAV